MTLSPIVLFVYNRPWHTQQTVEALQKNEMAGDSELFIYSDAAKNDQASEGVNAVREYIETINGFKKITLIKRDKNWGLADSIIDGVTQIVNKYGKIIVLEDDLVTSPYFLNFMNDALEFYKNEEKVWHVSGYCPPLNKVIKEHFFIKPTSCWGWATWENRWSFFKKDSDHFLNWFDKERRKDFNINNSYDYFSQIKLNYQNKINTWAIFWYATVYENNGLSLHPKESFVENIGHDGSGIHCGEDVNYSVEPANAYSNIFTGEIKIVGTYNKALERYYLGMKKSILTGIMKRIFKGKL